MELNIKRFRINELLEKQTCPVCGCLRCLTETPILSYPIVNKPNLISFYCHECDHEWEEMYIIKLTLERVENEKAT